MVHGCTCIALILILKCLEMYIDNYILINKNLDKQNWCKHFSILPWFFFEFFFYYHSLISYTEWGTSKSRNHLIFLCSALKHDLAEIKLAMGKDLIYWTLLSSSWCLACLKWQSYYYSSACLITSPQVYRSLLAKITGVLCTFCIHFVNYTSDRSETA